MLAEERSRAGPAPEASKAMLKLQLGDHPYGRPPIGLRNIIETVSPRTIRGSTTPITGPSARHCW